MKKFVILFFVLVFSLFVLPRSSFGSEQYDSSSFEYVVEDNHAIIEAYTGESTRVVVPSSIDGYSVYSIEAAFKGNNTVEEVVIKEGVCLIGHDTFAYCTKLKKVTIPSTVQSLGSNAFENAGIENIVLPENLTYVGYACFRGCESLKFIRSEASKITLDEYAVYNTGIEYMQLKDEPRYYGNTFSESCLFAYDDFSASIMNIKPIYAYTKFMKPLPALLKATLSSFIMFIVFGLILAIILLIRWLIIKLGKDKVTIYKRYSDNFLKSIKSDKRSATIVYKRPKFFRDELKYIRAILYVYLFFVVFYVVSYVIIKSRNILLITVLNFFLLLGIIIFYFIIVCLIQGLKNKYYRKRNRLPKSTIRIRRIGRGHRHDK